MVGSVFGTGTADTAAPSLHRGPDGTVLLTYGGPGLRDGESTLWHSELSPDRSSWSDPRAIISSSRLMVNWADFATLTTASDGTLWAQWFQRSSDPHGWSYSGWFARSVDGGDTWSTPAPLGQEFVSLAPLSGGRIMAVWLESVGEPSAKGQSKEPETYAPQMRLAAGLLEPDGSTSKQWVLDGDVCTCCQTSLAVLPGDRLLVTYRGRAPGEIRDNKVATFDGAEWSEPFLLHPDGWVIPGCPVNGPAADARGDVVAVAWFTAAGGVTRVQAKFSVDGARTFGGPIAIGLGRPLGRLDIAMLADGSALVSWLEAGGEGDNAGLYVRRIFQDGSSSVAQLVAPASAARASGFARMAATDGEGLPVVVAWTDAIPADASDSKSGAQTRVRTAVVDASMLPKREAAGKPPAASGAYAVIRSGNLYFPEMCTPSPRPTLSGSR